MLKRRLIFGVLLSIAVLISSCESKKAGSEKVSLNKESSDPLPSWNEGSSKSNIIAFVESVVNEKGASYVPAVDRIAVFDNDGTLWPEQPMYFQLIFAVEQVKALAQEHPEWKDQEPFSFILNDDLQGLMSSGIPGLMKIIMATHAGNSTDEFRGIVREWAANARHPTLNKPYTKLVYQPMLELLEYLRGNDFKTYIVSGGGVDFMRALVTEVYGIPEEQIIGSTISTEYVYNDGRPEIRRLPEIDFIDDKEGKPVNIWKIIGKKPVFAAGNSDGDLAMLQWTASNKLKTYKLYVHHTDSLREWAYDRASHIGRLDKGLDQAKRDGWAVVDMREDWKVIYPE